MEKRLRQFLAVAELKSLSRAAERLFVSQPALTQTMKKLEQELGVPLFRRSGRGITLTAYGDKLLEQTRIMQRVHENAMLEIARLRDHRERELRIGVGLAWWHLFFRDLLTEYRSDFPGAPMHIELGNHLRSMDQLLCGDIDLFLGHEIVGLNDKTGVAFDPLFSCVDGAWVRRDHPLADREGVRPDDLLSYPHLDVTPDESRYWSVIDDPASKEFRRSTYQLRQRVIWSTSSMTAGLDILRDSNAILTYTASMSDYFSRRGLVELAIDLPQRHRVGFYTRSREAQSPAVVDIIGRVRACLDESRLRDHRLEPI